MSFSKSCRLFALAASTVLTLTTFSQLAAAQQVTYFDFNTPANNPSLTSYQCSSGVPGSLLFCFNDSTGANASPSYISDTFPASIDPNQADNPPVSSTQSAVQLTPPAQAQAASMWFTVPQKVANGFTAYFTIKITPSAASYATADGIAFVIQNASGGGANALCAEGGSGLTAVGGNGGCMGYGGIDNSLAFEFDTYHNPWDPQDNPNNFNNDNHVAIQNCGAGLPNSPDHTGSCLVQLNSSTTPMGAIISNPPGLTLADGNVHQVVIVYSGPNEATPNLLQVFIDPPFNPETQTPSMMAVPVLSGTYNLAANLNLINSAAAPAPPSLDSAYVGFTSATGAAFETHELMNWTFTPHTTVTQEQPIAQNGQPTTFPFGVDTLASTFPATTPTTGITQVVTSNTISPALFSQLIANTPFAGSQCQVYDGTGGNCVIYSTSCVTTGTTTVVPCPPADPNNPFVLSSAYQNSTQPLSPGFLQGDPLYSPVATIVGDGTNATVTCSGECSVTNGQTVSVLSSSNPGFDGTVTVQNANPSAPNTFTFASSVSGSATGGYLTSNNVQNIFVSYTPQTIDGTTIGRPSSFSDFVVTSITASPVSLSIQAPSGITYGETAQVVVNASSGPADTSSSVTPGNGSPTGNVLLTVDNNPALTQTLTPGAAGSNSSTATFSLSGLTGGTHTLSVSYPGSGYFQANSTTGSLTIGQAASKIAITADTPNPANVQTAVSLTFSVAGSVSGTPTGSYSVSSSVAGDPTCNGTLGAGVGSCSLTFTTEGARTLTIKYNGDTNFAGSSTTVVQNVTGPIATLSATSLNFGSFYVGGVGLQSVTVTNTGTTAMTINEPLLFDVGNGDSKEFIALSLCPSSLAAGKSCVIEIVFIAAVPSNATQTATLKVMDNAPGNPQQVSLTATVLNPGATFSPKSIGFGTDSVGSTNTSSAILRNTGTTPLNISRVGIGGANPAQFSQTNNCPATLAPNASCTFSVSFQPTKTGAMTATINVIDNMQSGSTQLPLSGTGK